MENVETTDLRGVLEDHKPAEQYNPTEKEQRLAGELTSRFGEAQRARAGYDQQWELNRQYLKGNQFIFRNQSTDTLYRLPPEDEHRLFAQENILRPTMRTLLGKLTRAVPTWAIVPATNDLAEIRGADTAEALLKYQFRRLRLIRLYIDQYRDVCTFGPGYAKLWWDKEAGRDIWVCETCEHITYEGGEDTPCPECLARAELQHEADVENAQKEHESLLPEAGTLPEPPEFPEVPTLVKQKEGDVQAEVIDPRDFFVDPGATRLEKARWVCHRVTSPVSELRARFPDMAKYIAADMGLQSDSPGSVLQGLSAVNEDSQQFDCHAQLLEFHEWPTEDHPDGRIISMCNGIVLEEEDHPLFKDLARLPFYLFGWEWNKGELYPEGWITQAAPTQRELNLLLTQMREQRELTNRPKMLAAFDAGIPVDEMDATPGQVILHNPSTREPRYLDIPAFAHYVYSEIERMKGGVRSQASVSEQEVGLTAGDVSGRFAAIMEAQADQQVGPVLQYNSGEWIEFGRGIVLICQSRYTDQRTWTVTGDERAMTYEFGEMNLQPGWDVEFQEDDAFSSNKAVRLQQSIELVPTGIYNDPMTGVLDKKMFAKAARLKLPGVGPETRSADHAAAAAIPGLIEHGQPWQPRPWDNPEIFVEELEAWLKGPGRSAEPALLEEVAKAYKYYLTHTQAAMRQRQAMAQAQGAGQPGAGAPPPAGQPQAESPAVAEADAAVQQADQAAEGAAQISTAHEG